MEKITYIIPIHKINKTIEQYLTSALASLKNITNNKDNKVCFVGPKKVIEKVKTNCNLLNDVVLIENEEQTDFYSQVNKAILQCVTPYFSILEIDDKFKPYWLDIMQEYSKNDISLLLPINEIYEKDNMIGLANEIAWSSSFANEKGENDSGMGLGYIDMDCLDTFCDFSINGGLFKTEDVMSVGLFKPSLKFAAKYEFLRRLAYNGKNIYVAPKIGYEHLIGREDSYIENLQQEISQEEIKYLMELSNQEYFFKEDRNKTFKKDALEA